MAHVLTFDREDAERYADIVMAAATAIADGHETRAAAELAPIAGDLWMGSLSQAPGSGESEGRATPRRKDDALRAIVFARDHFRCTYCGGRVVPRSILVALSDLFPAEIPYHRAYKRGATHPVFWALAPEADHVFAHSRGGASTLENLTTLHAACNTAKSDSLAARAAIAQTQDDWDGLVSQYPALVEAGAGTVRAHYHRKWVRLYARANALLQT